MMHAVGLPCAEPKQGKTEPCGSDLGLRLNFGHCRFVQSHRNALQVLGIDFCYGTADVASLRLIAFALQIVSTTEFSCAALYVIHLSCRA